LPTYLSPFGLTKEDCREFGIALRESQQPSIDAFLFDRDDPTFMRIGKLAIAANLIANENMQNLFGENNSEGSQPWYDYLLNLMGNRNNFMSNNLSIITFNYDRSFEYFLYYALKQRFGLSERELPRYITNSIRTVHIYGQLGIPHFYDAHNGRRYENIVNEENLQKCIDEISLIYEVDSKGKDSANFERVYDIITETDLLVFLGFGYHQENIRRLQLKKYYRTLELVGTCYKSEDGEVRRYKSTILDNSALQTFESIQLLNCEVREFLARTDRLK
jgi:hypothetical protein